MSVTSNIIQISQSFNLDDTLVAAICEVESSGIPGKTRYESTWTYFEDPKSYAASLGITEETETLLQKFSYGPMQVMGAVAREHGYRGHLPLLCSEYLGVYYGCVHLRWLTLKHGYSGDDLISSYNWGTPRKGGDQQYLNQNYVDQVKKWVQYFKDHGVHDS